MSGIQDFEVLVWLSRVLSAGVWICCILAHLYVQPLGLCSEVKIGGCGCILHESGGYLEEEGGLSSGTEMGLQ